VSTRGHFLAASFAIILRRMSNANPLEDLVARMTVRELAERGGRSVTDIAVFALGGGRTAGPTKAASAAPRANGAKVAAAPRPRAKGVDTRSAQGRAQYERDVLGVLARSKSPTNAQAVRAQIGGTPAQARAALNRLIETGEVQYEGKARATRYWAT
jgi:hypothetical protein